MTQFRKGVVPLIGLMTVLFFVFLLSTAFVEEEKDTNKENESADVSAMKVAKDKDGALRPLTPAEEKKLNAEMQKALAKYPKHNAKQKDDGTISLVVAPHTFNAVVAHKGPDGKIHLNCSDETVHTQAEEELPEE